MKDKILHLEDCIPVALVQDDAIVARDGSVTVGWELFPPEEYSVSQESYDSMTTLMASAFRGLPEWTMVHRQDIYRRRLYHSEPTGHFLDDCYSSHFEGRPFLEHRQFIWFTFNPAREGRAGVMKSTLGGAATGISYKAPEMKGLVERLRHFESRCTEFVSVFASAGGFRSRRLTTASLEGTPGVESGVIEDYKNWFASEVDGTDISQENGTYLDRDCRRMFSYSFSTTDDMPGEVSNTVKVRALSTPDCEILLSAASPIGSDLPYEHMVNFYWLVPNQGEALRDLDRRKKNMTSMAKGSAENTVNAEGIAEFINLIHAESTVAVYTHMNLFAWGKRDDEMAIRGTAGAALSQMGLTGKLNTFDMPQLWLAAMPGGELEIGEDNLMIAELEMSMCLGINESFIRDFPGGTLRITDRHRHTPVVIDTQQAAYDAKLIENYNAFILGPSGSGKSFFTNWYVRNCFDAGQHVFIIDKGDSYEGLCSLIHEETGGQDGIYYTWSAEHPFAFAPFQDCRRWKEDDTDTGMSFILSMIKILWTPKQGWDSVRSPILYSIVSDFIASLSAEGEDPIFEDFCSFLRDEVRPRILQDDEASPVKNMDREALKQLIAEKQLQIKVKGKSDERIREEIISQLPHREPYIVGGEAVTRDIFDVRGLCIALAPYAQGGRFGFLLNERHPADLFRSRFVVFEVDAISEIDPTLYALCTFCIIHSFERKMHSDDTAFRLMFIEEAWQAIATEGTAEYLRGLWKTARKYHTSATVVTQQVSDIISSPVIKDAILNNSPVKILLDQQSNAASFEDISNLLGLSPLDRALVRSVGRHLAESVRYKEVFITLGGKKSGVFALEVSPEEALVYESDKVKKRPLFEETARCGSLRNAIKNLTRK